MAGWASFGASTAIAFGVFWLIQVCIILKGTEGIKALESWSAPLLLLGGSPFSSGRFGTAAASPEFSRARQAAAGNDAILGALPCRLTANVGYWATLSLNIPDFTRYAKASAHR